MYLRVLSFYWHRQRAHLSNSVHRTRRRKEFRPLFCAMYPEAYWQRLEKPANNIITHPNSETVCSIVTKSMLIIFHLQTGFWFACLFNFDCTIVISAERNEAVKSTDGSSRAGKVCHLTIQQTTLRRTKIPMSGCKSKLCLRLISTSCWQ